MTKRAHNFVDLTGKVFGRWTVLGLGKIEQRKDGKRRALWLCRCECGTERLVFGGSLTYGSSVSCGCYRQELSYGREPGNKLPKGEATFRLIFKHYKYQAARKNRVWELTLEQFRKLTKSNCYYCGDPPLTLMRGTRNTSWYTYNGVDRADNNKGYTVENSVTCCKKCNMAKGTMSHTEYIEHCKKVAAYRG